MTTSTRFLAQHERPAQLSDLDLATLPPALRILLLSDGTLTTALEAYRLAPVVAEVRSQETIRLDAENSRPLRAEIGTEAILRRVDIRDMTTSAILVKAESILLIERLPDAFARTLADSQKGLGEALSRARLECRRELLWYGREAGAGNTIARCYRVISHGQPVLLIEERFRYPGRQG
jgi:chorismate-pyruvate lyase